MPIRQSGKGSCSITTRRYPIEERRRTCEVLNKLTQLSRWEKEGVEREEGQKEGGRKGGRIKKYF